MLVISYPRYNELCNKCNFYYNRKNILETKLKIETFWCELGEIKPNLINPKKIDKKRYNQLLSSLQEFPEMLEIREIIIDENNVALAGNMKLKALKELNEQGAWVKRVTGLSEHQKKEFLIKDNQIYGEWDIDLLSAILDDKEISAWVIDDEISKLVQQIADNTFDEEMAGYTNETAVYPIVPKLSEKYDCVIIFSTNEIDTNWLEAVLKIETEKCYKCERLGKSHVISVEKFQQCLKENTFGIE